MLGGTFLACSSTPSGATTSDLRDDAASDVRSSDPNGDGSAADGGGLDGAMDPVGEAGSCAVVAPATCPTSVPSFANDVLPILNAKCNGCHTGPPQPWALTNQDDVQTWAISISIDLTRCSMPPADAGTPNLTKAELDAVLGWIVCGSPNN